MNNNIHRADCRCRRCRAPSARTTLTAAPYKGRQTFSRALIATYLTVVAAGGAIIWEAVR